MNGLLSVVIGWLKPTTLPHWDIAEVVGGGPDDGELYWVQADWR